jgi:hypothetical protein
MKLPISIRFILLAILLIFWGYLSYCWIQNSNHHSTKKYHFEPSIDSTIHILERWKQFILRRSDEQIDSKNDKIDSLLCELEKQPRVIYKIKWKTKEDPKVKDLESINEIYKVENEYLKSINNQLTKDIDSLKHIQVPKVKSRPKDTIKYKDLGRRSFFNIFKWRRRSAKSADDPKFR